MHKYILKLAVPNIISNITIPLIGLVDLALMGHLGSEVHIGAITLGTMIFNFIYWGFGFLRMSTGGFVAQSVGAKDESECLHILLRAFLLSSVISLFIIALQLPIEWISFQLINGSAEVEQLATSYFRIRIWAAPATLGLYVLNGWFLGMQRSSLVMISSILANVFNLAFSFFFVYVLKMNSEGVALGTVVAQYVGLIVSLLLLRYNYGHLFSLFNRQLILKTDFLKRFFRVNSDIFVRTFCIIIVFTLFTSKSAGINDHILAVNAILMQFLMFFSFFIDGFAFAGEALSGKYMGMNSKNKLIKLSQHLFTWALVLGVCFSSLYFFAGEFIITLLTDKTDILNTARSYMPWVIVIPIISFASFVWDGIFIGLTASKEMRNSMLAATLLLFLPVFFLLQPYWGNHAIWLAMLFFMFGRALFQTLLFPKVLRKSFPTSNL